MKTEILEWRSYFNEVCVLKIRYLGPTIFNNFIIFSCVSRCACMFKFLLFSQFLRRKMRLIKNHVSRLLWSACTDNLPKYNSLFSIWMYDVKDSVWWCRTLSRNLAHILFETRENAFLLEQSSRQRWSMKCKYM